MPRPFPRARIPRGAPAPSPGPATSSGAPPRSGLASFPQSPAPPRPLLLSGEPLPVPWRAPSLGCSNQWPVHRWRVARTEQPLALRPAPSDTRQAVTLRSHSVVALAETGPQKYTSGPGSAGLVTSGDTTQGFSSLTDLTGRDHCSQPRETGTLGGIGSGPLTPTPRLLPRQGWFSQQHPPTVPQTREFTTQWAGSANSMSS